MELLRIIRTFLLVLLCCHQAAAEYIRLCTLRASEILPVTFDKERGEFVQLDNNQGGGNNYTASGNRHLRTEDTAAISVATHRRIQQEDATGKVFYVRQCLCSTRPWETEIKAFCPLDKTTCGIPRSPEEPIGCFNQSSRTSLIRNAWPVIVLWYGGLVIFLIFTTQGRNARYYVISKCCNRNLNRQLIEQYWYIEGGYWRRRRRRRTTLPTLLQDVRQRGRARNEHEVPPLPSNTLDHLVDTHSEHPPNQLALKTKRYVVPSNVQDEDDLACTICFSPLADGDRVGALACNHSFHVDCLKLWLPRRNICPLCQAPDVASPQYQPHGGEEEDENSILQEQPLSDEDNQEDSQRPIDGHTSDGPVLAVTPQAQSPTWLHHRAVDIFRERTIPQRRY